MRPSIGSSNALVSVCRAASVLDQSRHARLAGRLFGVFSDMPAALRSVYLADELGRIGGVAKLRRVLDFGCGRGIGCCLLARLLPAARVMGLDASEERVAQSKDLAARLELRNVEFVPGRTPFKPAGQGFELIVAFDVLEHVPNDSDLLAQLCAVLAPGGWLLVEVPAAVHEPGEALPHGHLREYVPGVIPQLVAARGLRTVSEQFTFTGAVGTIMQRAERRMSNAPNWLTRLAWRIAYVLSYHRDVREAMAQVGRCRQEAHTWPSRRLPLALLIRAQKPVRAVPTDQFATGEALTARKT